MCDNLCCCSRYHFSDGTSCEGGYLQNRCTNFKCLFCNVFGSALAPLLISFIALDYLSTQQVYLFICLITLLITCLCIENKKTQLIYAVFTIIPIFLMTLPEKIFHEFSKNSYQEKTYPSLVLENKHGIIQVYNTKEDQVVFGANVYDGKLNTNIFHNSNGIDRAYLLTALKPQAEHVLVIGLSTEVLG